MVCVSMMTGWYVIVDRCKPSSEKVLWFGKQARLRKRCWATFTISRTSVARACGVHGIWCANFHNMRRRGLPQCESGGALCKLWFLDWCLPQFPTLVSSTNPTKSSATPAKIMWLVVVWNTYFSKLYLLMYFAVTFGIWKLNESKQNFYFENFGPSETCREVGVASCIFVWWHRHIIDKRANVRKGVDSRTCIPTSLKKQALMPPALVCRTLFKSKGISTTVIRAVASKVTVCSATRMAP